MPLRWAGTAYDVRRLGGDCHPYFSTDMPLLGRMALCGLNRHLTEHLSVLANGRSKMAMATVDVLIPTYNRSAMLRRSLESIRVQTYANSVMPGELLCIAESPFRCGWTLRRTGRQRYQSRSH